MMAGYRPDPAFLALGEGFADPVQAADFPKTILRFRNDRHAATVGLDSLSDDAWLRHFGRFEPLPDNLPEPLAQRYHGHQFRVYNPEIGDGRGFLFAQMRDDRDRLLDLGTKGSGTTPFSRSGDGRLTLKGGVREILATEMLEALGVNTSKTFSLIETGESLMRNDEPSPTRSAVMVRLSHGHIRLGSFQRLAVLGESDNLQKLVKYSLATYFDGASTITIQDQAIELLDHVTARTAGLAADLMVSGFVHGVLNSDNINITGECFDYGPWRFLAEFDPGFTAAYFDHQGLYAYGRQPEAVQWDLYQFAGALLPILEETDMRPVLEQFPERFSEAMRERLVRRLGVKSISREKDEALILALHTLLAEHQPGYEQLFFDWYGGAASRERAAKSPLADIYASGEGKTFTALLRSLDPLECVDLDKDYFRGSAPCTMLIDEVEAIWSHIDERDDWQPLDDKIRDIRNMAAALGNCE